MACLFSVSASAQDRWSVGAGMISADANYRGQTSDVFVVPAISYEGERLYFRGIELGYNLNDDRRSQWTWVASWAPFRFKPAENDDLALQQLDRRNFRIETGLSYRTFGRWGEFRGQALLNARNLSSGERGSLTYTFPLSRQPQNWQFGPSLTLAYLSGRYIDYYYGVSNEEAVRSGLPVYEASAAWNTSLGLGGFYRFNDRWSVFGNLTRTFVDSEIRNSPMTEDRNSRNIIIFVTYRL
ncbi:MAG: MipA/OmpV family protein [Idiomarina sp.]|nr:MipA/OmpV family protein [Idiomarina sp.]